MLVIAATQNSGKLRELTRIFLPLGIEVAAQSVFCPNLSVEETGTTFAENAFLKAEAVHRLTGKAALADDSGLCVDALGGRPGVYSARYGGADTPQSEKIRLLLEELRDIPADKRGAQFVAHICFLGEDGARLDARGVCEGTIGYAPRGDGGFGYDPIFMVGARSFSELPDAEKDAISHRGKALRKLERGMRELRGNEKNK